MGMMSAGKESDRDTVILLHGIRLNKWSLFFVQRALKRAGYNALPISYPSTHKSLDDIADWLYQKHLGEDFWERNNKVHFVTHSMGGLVARRYLSKYKNQLSSSKVGRTVMMGPPNRGSEIADLLHRFLPYQWMFGPAGTELATNIQEQNNDLLYYETGVIAGSVSWLYPLSGLIIPGPNDGRVAVERTKLEHLTDHITLTTSHTFMVYRPLVHRQILSFLRHGRFGR